MFWGRASGRSWMLSQPTLPLPSQASLCEQMFFILTDPASLPFWAETVSCLRRRLLAA